MIVEIYQKV